MADVNQVFESNDYHVEILRDVSNNWTGISAVCTKPITCVVNLNGTVREYSIPAGTFTRSFVANVPTTPRFLKNLDVSYGPSVNWSVTVERR